MNLLSLMKVKTKFLKKKLLRRLLKNVMHMLKLFIIGKKNFKMRLKILLKKLLLQITGLVSKKLQKEFWYSVKEIK